MIIRVCYDIQYVYIILIIYIHGSDPRAVEVRLIFSPLKLVHQISNRCCVLLFVLYHGVVPSDVSLVVVAITVVAAC